MPRRNPSPAPRNRLKPKGKKRPRSWHRGPRQDRLFKTAAESMERAA